MLINIQFLRLVAAMLVVVYHVSFQLPGGGGTEHGLFWLGQATGFAGVDVFFVISGFIMAYTTIGEIGPVRSLDFARRRIARIFSGYWPFFFLALAVFYWARPQHFADANLLTSFFLWPQPLNLVLLEITWTLSFELYFYLLFALLVWLVPDRFRMKTCAAATVIIVVLFLYRHFVSASFDAGRLHLMPFAEHFLASPFVAEFFAGAVTAYWLSRRPRGLAWTWLLLGAALFLGGSVVNARLFDGDLEQGYHVVPRVLLFGSASILIVAGLVRLETAGRTARAGFSIVTGGASYAIYLSHIPILALAQLLGMPMLLNGRPAGLVAAAYSVLSLLILGISVVHYRKLERPLHRLFKSLLGVPRHEKRRVSGTAS
jgi:exopolysaccharide production protein ExoZ